MKGSYLKKPFLTSTRFLILISHNLLLGYVGALGTVPQPDARTGVLVPLLRHPPTAKVEIQILATPPANGKTCPATSGAQWGT